MNDFEILLPMDKVVVIRPYSLDVDQEIFKIPQEDDAVLENPPSGFGLASAPVPSAGETEGKGFAFWTLRFNAFFVRRGKN